MSECVFVCLLSFLENAKFDRNINQALEQQHGLKKPGGTALAPVSVVLVLTPIALNGIATSGFNERRMELHH